MTLLSINQLIKRKENALLLPEINLEISCGQCVVIQCNNKLGNLLIELIVGAVPASSGEVRFDGVELRQQFKQQAHKIGISLLNDGNYDQLKVKDYLLFYRDLYEATTNIDHILMRIGLHNYKNTRISKLSFSEQKRLQLGRAIIHNPALIILEEPEQNVDIESHIIIRSVISQLCAEGKAVFITTSYLSDAISITNEVYRLTESELKKIDVIAEPDEANNLTIPDNLSEASKNNELTLVEPNLPTSTQQNSVPIQSAQNMQEDIASNIIKEAQPVRVDKIPAKVEDKIILFDPTEIHFIESSDGVSLLHVKGETFPCTFTLNELEIKLKPFGFFRCHRSYIVNLQKVREIITWTRNSYSLILDDHKKSSIPLSKGKHDELRTILGI